MTVTYCPKCGNTILGNANFCAQCGSNLSKPNAPVTLTGGRIVLLIFVSFAVFAFAWGTKSYLEGVRPTQAFKPENKESPKAEADYSDHKLHELRKTARDNPSDIEAQRALAADLIEKVRNIPTPPSTLIFETIETLRAILNIDAKDPEALIAMADISFDQQAFAKAVDFYERYLEIETEDINARSRYASSLTFLSQFDKALAELKKVTDKDPKNFHAKAYTAVTYAQMGKTKEAEIVGKEALELAPSKEAKERFSLFLENLKSSPMQASSPSKDEPTLVKYIRGNPVAGPKFVSYKENPDGTLFLLFENFPMEQMPPFAKDKFFNGIKDAAKKDSKAPSKVLFLDSMTGKELASLDLK